MNTKRIFGCFVLLILSIFSYAQQRFEIGALIGGSCYQGDVLGSSVTEIAPNIHGSVNLNAAYFFNNFLGVRVAGGYGKMSGGDKYAETAQRRARNLSFVSNVYTTGVRLEFNVTGFNPADNQNFTIYPFIGYHHTFFNPKAEYKGKLYALQPLGTEGQGLAKYPDRQRYKLNAGAILYGGGMRIAIAPKWSLGLEYGAYRIFSDYIDDVAGNYAPYTDILQETGNQVAAALSNREGELLGTDQIILKKSTDVRGNHKVFDYYFQFGLTVNYHFFDPLSDKARNSFRKKRKTSECFKF
jgi:hypothetical protein